MSGCSDDHASTNDTPNSRVELADALVEHVNESMAKSETVAAPAAESAAATKPCRGKIDE